ncbi:DUF1456 family protein [Cytobacillus kochii]|uniref:DUF1456 family protein n=1 Tax=Cytobacillus kochii TaxID=859143 RepID=UPI00402A62B1
MVDNNDLLIRLRYALDIKNSEMAEIFKLGEEEVTVPEVVKILKKFDEDEAENRIELTDAMLNSFLNGLIIYKRGKQEPKPGQANTPDPSITSHRHINNILLKKVKIALALTTEDMINIFRKAGLNVSKGEIGAFLRKEGHKNYKVCLDHFARNFLKGLTVKYREA